MGTARETFDVLVVGGGISGLACAHALAGNHDVALIEGSQRVGGLVRTVHVEGPLPLRHEAGPESLTTSDEVEALARELEVTLHPVPKASSKRYVVHRRRLVEVPMAPPKLLGSPLLSPGGKLRLLTEPWRSREPGLDGSVAAFVRHRLGRQALEALVDPLISGIHAGDPEQLSMRACFPKVVEMVEQHGSVFAAMKARRAARGSAPARRPGLAKPEGGLETLTSALGRALGSRVRTGCEARKITPDPTGWRVQTDSATLHCDELVLALPVHATTRLLGAVVPEAARALSSMVCEDLVSVLALWPRAAVGHPLDGFGYLAPGRESLRHLGTLFSSSIDPRCAPDGHVLLRVLLGGARHPEVAAAGDEALQAIVRDEVQPLLGITSEPLWTSVQRHPGALPRFDLQHVERVRRLEAALPGGLTVLGNFTRGIGLAALVADARRAAAELSSRSASLTS
jgi:oxygen-dependent protoporphyrinogen oxidase